MNPKKYCPPCKVCGKTVSRHSKQFCSHYCQRTYQTNSIIEAWKLGTHNGRSGNQENSIALSSAVRNYILLRDNYTCCSCDWNLKHPISGVSPVQVHHLDGNFKNCKEDNLMTLCPNCHALTLNFGGRNRGNGRSNRYASIV